MLFIQKIEIMNRKLLERRAYMRPAIKVCELQTEKLLSISGQHEDAGSGGTIGNAKQGWFDEEEEESSAASLFYSASQTMNSGSTGERSY
ncbi:MAG: hypothetical protein HG422_05235 [Prevotella sp.]|nr:hypothetical protein [Prevotella sp.]